MTSPSFISRASAWPVRMFKRFSSDRCAPMAASIAFYSAFSLAPTLVMVIAVAGLVFGAEAAQGQLFGQISGMLGKEAAASVQAIVEHAHQSSGGGLAALISFALLAVGASATFSSLNTALSIIWPSEDKSKSGVTTLVKVRLISFGLVMGVAFLLIISLVLDTAVQAAGKWAFGASPLVVLTDVAQFVIALLILSCAFAALLKYLPDGHVPWRDALVGGSIAAVLFSVGKKLFALYLTHAGTASAFGAAGSLAVLLMWLYFAAAVLLLGAEAAASRVEQRGEEHEGGGAKKSGENRGATANAVPQILTSGRAVMSSVSAPSNPQPFASAKPLITVGRTAGTLRSPAASQFLRLLKANPVRLAAALVGAGLFVFARSSPSGSSRK
ncbi:YihY/virulence factor BrkB family protein [Caballeronia sp. S22]|uniref:YihY/virulence factor BrkB family protein n=1 Tax=Caballeronia sp. S22 TaxID=3137182 RepID=UPI003531194A